MTDKEWQRMKDEEAYIAPEIIQFLSAIPDFDERGVEHTAPCHCGGTIHATRAKYNGHLYAYCDKCKARIIE